MTYTEHLAVWFPQLVARSRSRGDALDVGSLRTPVTYGLRIDTDRLGLLRKTQAINIGFVQRAGSAKEADLSLSILMHIARYATVAVSPLSLCVLDGIWFGSVHLQSRPSRTLQVEDYVTAAIGYYNLRRWIYGHTSP